MITKDMKDWTMDELITAATWKVMDEIIKGRLSDGVHSAILMALQWRARQQDTSPSPLTNEGDKQGGGNG